MKKRVVLSCTANSAYNFFLPIATRLWRKRINYEPVVILVGTEGDWSSTHSKVVYDEVFGKERIEFFPGIPGIPDSMVSMGLRQHVAALDFDQDDILLVGDVDLFPISKEFYHRYNPSKNPIGIYHAEMYNDRYWPAYGMSMPVRNWREVMGVTVGDFRGSVEKAFTEWNAKELVAAHKADFRDTRFWTFDEEYASFKIKNSGFSKNIATFPSSFDGRNPGRAVSGQPRASDYVDFHCRRPGWTEEIWPDIRHLLTQLIQDDIEWVDGYVDVYRAAIKRCL